jgi:hypothetical protein
MFVKITNGSVDQYPYTVGDLRRDNPNVSFPKQVREETMAEYGMYPVSYEGAPEWDQRTQIVKHSNVPELVGGEWKLTKTVVDKTADQIADYDAGIAKQVREERDTKLSETDFYALSDVTMSTEMATYRQALRDITDHANFPYLTEEDWPTAL